MEGSSKKIETILDIAIKTVEEKITKGEMGVERDTTIFVLGSKGVGKSTLINRFLDREGVPKPTLALEYSFGRRTASGYSLEKQVCNVWELGNLGIGLAQIPIGSHGIERFTAYIVLDLSQPQRIWLDLEKALSGLQEGYRKYCTEAVVSKMTEKTRERIGLDHMDLNTLDLYPFSIVIVGGKYDIFQDFGELYKKCAIMTLSHNQVFLDPEVKKHVCRCLRSIAHAIGAALIFYSVKSSGLIKIVRDTMNHFAFGSPSNPIRKHAVDYNGPLIIGFGKDSWESIGVMPSNAGQIGVNFTTQVPQEEEDNSLPPDPAKDPEFTEAVIDEMRARRDEEMMMFLRDRQMLSKFHKIEEGSKDAEVL